MSGGFFRGTSADQDTRFSNKHAKLLKTQKFAPELDHVVDMTKVKMDVMRPWIATRVTELLGFEDEVLINFVYGLLEAKEVDGKHIQIQLTGFMEKNTVKFMKELWNLLLSAQQNASGVPQQFLDAKEAEIQKRKAEDDKIAQEIQKKREKDGRDPELERHKRTDGNAGKSGFDDVAPGSMSNRPSVLSEEERGLDMRHGAKTKDREGHRSRSISTSPHVRRRSISPRRRSPSPSRRSRSSERQHRSSRRSISLGRSVSPRRHSPRSAHPTARRRSPFSRRRSPSITRSRSPAPHRRRSPHIRRRSPSFVRRRSPPPYRRRSPAYPPRRSPSPARRRSPVHHRPSPPARRRSPSPVRRRPPSPVRRRSPSPFLSPPSRSPKHRRRSPQSPRIRAANRRVSPKERRSTSPYNSRSPSNRSRRSLSRDIERGTNGVHFNKEELQRNRERRPDAHHVNDIERTEHPNVKRNTSRRSTEFLRSPKHDSRDQKAVNKHRPGHSPVQSELHDVGRNPTLNSPLKSTRKHSPREESFETSDDEEEASRAREDARRANSSRRKNKDLSIETKKVRAEDSIPGEDSPYRSVGYNARDRHPDNSGSRRLSEQESGKDLRKKHESHLSESSSEQEHDGRRMTHQPKSPDDFQDKSPRRVVKDASCSKERISNDMKDSFGAAYEVTAKRKSSARVNEVSQSDDEASPVRKSKKRIEGSHPGTDSSDSTEHDRHRSHVERKRHSKHKRHYDESSESDSELDEKEAKRRRKEEKRLKKEEKRRRREERHRRKSERRAIKQKLKSVDTVTPPSDLDKGHGSESDADDVRKKGSYGGREEESEQRRLEIELREKALESLRAKKAISH